MGMNEFLFFILFCEYWIWTVLMVHCNHHTPFHFWKDRWQALSEKSAWLVAATERRLSSAHFPAISDLVAIANKDHHLDVHSRKRKIIFAYSCHPLLLRCWCKNGVVLTKLRNLRRDYEIDFSYRKYNLSDFPITYKGEICIKCCEI